MVYQTRSRTLTRARSNSAPGVLSPIKQGKPETFHPVANTPPRETSPSNSLPNMVSATSIVMEAGQCSEPTAHDVQGDDGDASPLTSSFSEDAPQAASINRAINSSVEERSDDDSDRKIESESGVHNLSRSRDDDLEQDIDGYRTPVERHGSLLSYSSNDKSITPISAARGKLTREEYDRIQRRRSAGIRILEPSEFSDSTPEPDSDKATSPNVPYYGKGKGVDPRNWGNINLGQEELDPEAQQQILASFQRPRILPSGPQYYSDESFAKDSSNGQRETPNRSLESLYTPGVRASLAANPPRYPPGLPRVTSNEFPVGTSSNSSTPTPAPRKSYKTTMEEVTDDEDDSNYQSSRHVHYPSEPSPTVASSAATVRSKRRTESSPSSSSDSSSSSSSDDDSDSNSERPQKQRKRSKEVSKRKRAKAKAKAKSVKKARAVTPLTDTIHERIRDTVQGKVRRHTPPASRRDPLRPVNQLAGGSHLAQILRRSSSPSSDDSSESSSSDDDSSSSGDDDSSSTSDSSDKDSSSSSSSSSSASRRKNKKRSKKSKKRSSKKKSSRSKRSYLKPEPPAVYNGAPDTRTFQTFLEDAMDYVREGKVNKKLRVKKIARYLTGAAKTWYISAVADDVKSWRTQEFFVELYNHSFPPTFRMEQRKRLVNAAQGPTQNVRQFVLKLNELFNTTGITRTREKVLKLWESLRPDIQGGLYRADLNPETVSYERLVQRAERIEMILAIEENARKQTREQSKSREAPHRDERRKPQFNNTNKAPPRPPQNAGSHPHSRAPHASGSNRDQKAKFTQKKGQFNRDRERKPQLTEQQKAEYITNNKCFGCGEIGHHKSRCPKGQFVPGKGNRPPGVQVSGAKVSNKPNAKESKNARDTGVSDIWTGPIIISGVRIDGHQYEPLSGNVPTSPKEGRVSFLDALFAPGIGVSSTRVVTETDSDNESSSTDMPPLDDVSEYEDNEQSTYLNSDPDSDGDVPPLFQASDSEDSDDDWDEAPWTHNHEAPQPAPVPQVVRPQRKNPFVPRCAKCKNITLRKNVSDPTGLGYQTICECEITFLGEGHILYHYAMNGHPGKCILLPPKSIGDFWCRGIEFILSQSGTFPGEDPEDIPAEKRSFSVYQSYDRYIIMDSFYRRDACLPIVYARNPNFSLVEWYARVRARDNGLNLNLMPERYQWMASGWAANSFLCLGDLDVDTVEAYLTMHAPWIDDGGKPLPNRSTARFTVTRSLETDGYDIYDHHLRSSVFLPARLVLIPKFDLASWYEKTIMKADKAMRERHLQNYKSILGYLKRALLRESPDTSRHETPDLGTPYPDLWVASDENPNYLGCYLAAEYLIERLSRDDELSLLNWNTYMTLLFDEMAHEHRQRAAMHEITKFLCANVDTYGPNVSDTVGLDTKGVCLQLLHQFFNEMDIQRLEVTAAFQRLVHDVSEEFFYMLPVDFTPRNEVSNVGEQLDFQVAGAQIPRGKLPAIQRNASRVKESGRRVPRPIIVAVQINGQPARALIDSGSMADMMSTTLLDQLQIKKIELTKPLALQLAVQGSRSKINWGARARFQYQGIDEERYFDIANLSGYDLILGTPWLHQHSACIGFNDPKVVIGSVKSLPIKDGPWVAEVVTNAARLDDDERIENARKDVLAFAHPLFKKASETPLPPLRAINHQIPLIDEHKVYPWRAAKCPEKFRSQWAEKRDGYLRTGRWRVVAEKNASPMMILPKIDDPKRIRVVCDFRPRNSNTRKLSSPIPDPQAIRRRVAKAKFRSTMDGSDAFEQVRIEPSHVSRSAMQTPDGVMISEVMQQGDCNAPATFQSIMYYLFAPYIGRWMDVYLDDIIIYSDTIEEHIEHLKTVIQILADNKFYLAERKMRLFANQVKILGCIVDDDGIRMDPHKVDSVLKWPTPTNRDLLRGFLGSVGYLADDVDSIRIPMGVLSGITGDAVPFRWSFTEQRAFEDVKNKILEGSERNRVPLDYSDGAPPVWLVTDGCATGIAGVVIQGDDWKKGNVAAYYSAKLSAAQQNYPVHEIEALAGVESMLRYRDILQGQRFTWVTDHKGLTYLLNQKDLSGRQARWLEKLSSFDFDVKYVPGTENVLADALSRIYSNEAKGTMRARSEYTYHDVHDNDILDGFGVTRPVLVGGEATAHLSVHALNVAPVSLRPRKVVDYAPDKRKPKEMSESALFAQRMKGRIAFKGPRLETRTEGGNGMEDVQKSDSNTHLDGPSNDPPELPELLDVPPTPDVSNDPDNLQDRAFEINDVDGQDQVLESKLGQDAPDLNGDSFLDVVSGGRVGLDLQELIRHRYSNDITFKVVIEKPKEFRNFEYTPDGLLYLKVQDDIQLLCIPDIMHKNRRIREIVIDEAHSLLAHLGSRKTISYLRAHVWWKTMVHDVDLFCKSCSTCAQVKPDNQKPYGLLLPLGPPRYPWDVIGIDFMEPLPLSKDRNGTYDSLVVIVDHLTGMVHLVPGRTSYKARDVAELVFTDVYKLHGMPRAIVSDRDSKFTSQFWKHLNKLVGTQLKMSSAYHPQSDGLTERANRTIEQMLRQCIGPNQKDWVGKLPAIEFAINLARSETTGYSPFFLNSGRIPRSMIWDTATKTEFPGVRVFAQRLKNAIIQAHDNILDKRVKQTRDANRRRREVPFKLDDLVYVSIKNITLPKGTARKLVPKYIGPFRITRDFGNGTFQVALPDRLKQRGIHSSFNASLLRIHVPNDDRLFPGRSESQILPFEQFENEWAVDCITAHCGTGEDLMFTVKWKAGDETLLPLKDVEHLHALPEYLEALGLETLADLKRNKVKSRSVPIDTDPQIMYAGALCFNDDLSSARNNRNGIKCLPEIEERPIELVSSPHSTIYSFHDIFTPYTDFNMPPRRDLDFYNRHPRVSVLGPRSLLLATTSGTLLNMARAQVEAVFLNEQVLRKASKTGEFPANYSSPLGGNYLINILHDSPHWKNRFSLADKEGTIVVPDNPVPVIDDLLPKLPVDVSENEANLELLHRYQKSLTRHLLEKDEKDEKWRLIREKEKAIKRGVKEDIDSDRITARAILGKKTSIRPRRPAPYPQSILEGDETIPPPRSRTHQLSVTATPFQPAESSHSNAVAGPSGTAAADDAAPPVSATLDEYVDEVEEDAMDE